MNNSISPAPLPLYDSEQTIEFAKLLLDRAEGCLEIRVIHKDKKIGNAIGFFNSPSLVEQVCKKYHGKAQIYVSLNLRKSELLHAQPANALVHSRYAVAGSSEDVAEVSWLPIDFDTIRPSNKIAASTNELTQTKKMCETVATFLEGLGIHSYEGMSGNGYHLLVPTIPYPVSMLGTKRKNPFSTILKILAKKFDTEHATIDVSTCDSARVWKMYGTAAVKGGNTLARPWRTATLEIHSKLPGVDILSKFPMPINQTDCRPEASKQLKFLDLFKGARNVHS